MNKLKKDNFSSIRYVSPEGTIKETHAEVTLTIPIDNRVDMDILIEQIIDNIRIRSELEYRARHPIALNYASFEQWIIELLVPETKEIERNKYIAEIIKKDDSIK